MMCKEGDSRNIMNFLYIEKYYWSKKYGEEIKQVKEIVLNLLVCSKRNFFCFLFAVCIEFVSFRCNRFSKRLTR